MPTKVEYGPCSKCGQPNPKSTFNCRDCGAALPWSPAGTAASPMTTHTTPVNHGGPMGSGGSTPSSPAPQNQPPFTPPSQLPYRQPIPEPKTDYGPMIAQGIGGLVFLVGAGLWIGNMTGAFPTFPGLGYITMLIGGGVFKMGSADE